MLPCGMANQKILSSFALALRARREHLKLTQRQVAERATLSLRTIVSLERSERAPGMHVVHFLAHALRLEADSLSEGRVVARGAK